SEGTQNLKQAVRRCDARRGVPDSLATNLPIVFSQSRFRAMLAIWTAVNHRPFHTLSDPLFIEIVRLLRADASVPTPHTVSNDLARIYNQVAVSIQEKFKV
ncbi:hypothetical protein BDV93DRAFT_425937, partial [Ceratobasidium sp. AG-I]